MFKHRSTFFQWVVWVYLGVILSWLLLRLLFFDRFWWLAVINTIAIYLFVPLLFFVPIALWQRQWRTLAGLGLPLGVFLALHGNLFIPKFPPPIAASQRSITALTFNMLWDNENYPAIARLVQQSNADVIGLQEVRSQEKMNALIERFKANYPHHLYHPGNLDHNIALFSRFPITDWILFPDPPFKRGLQATLDLGNSPGKTARFLQVIVGHLTPNYPMEQVITQAQSWYDNRAAQVADLNRRVQNRQMPMLVLCDCNFTPTSQTYQTLRSRWKDSFAEVGWGLGHTFLGPYFITGRLDYVWHSPELQAINARVEEPAGSDHLPLVVKLRL